MTDVKGPRPTAVAELDAKPNAELDSELNDTEVSAPWLEDLLRQELPERMHLADAGFSDGVMLQLPQKARRFRLGDLSVWSGVAVGGAVGVLAIMRGVSFDLGIPAQAMALATVVGLALWGALASSEA